MEKRIFNTLFVLLLALTVNAQTPVADFSASVTSGCAPLGVTFKDLTTGTPKYWDWDFGNGQLSNQQNPYVVFNAPGTYTVKLVARNQDGADGETKETYITVYPSPSVGFSADKTTTCLPAVINFTGTATATDGSIDSYKWNFGDGETAATQNVQHTYAETGYYTVIFSATSSNGCTSQRGVSRYIRVVSGIVADFSSKPPAECKAPFNVAFTNESSGPGVLTYSWDFGNGNNSTDKNPTTAYTSSGNYTVKLTTKSSYGCESMVDSIIPATTFATTFTIPDSACTNQQVNFQNGSAPGAATLWSFGDGTQSAELSPVKVYGMANSYTVKLINKFADCTDSVTKVIKIVKPTADFTATNNTGCGEPLTVSFQDITPNSTGWQWDFGDGSTSTADPSPTHTYLVPGKYSVKLTVTTSTGCDASVTKTNFVNITPPTITVSNVPASGCLPAAISPVATASSPDGIASYSWDFGDGSPVVSGTLTPSYTYTVAGTYAITFTVTTGGGCVQPVTRLIRVGDKPTGNDFTVDAYGTCASDTVKFTPITPDANEWLWYFGDGDTSTQQFPHHIYQDTGKLKVILIASSNGCKGDSVVKKDFITKDAPIAKFNATIDCNNRLGVTFSDSSLIKNAVQYQWDFGDGHTSTDANPGLYTYAQPGRYDVKLTITDGVCTSTKIRTVFLDPLDGTFTASKTKLCLNEKLTFTAIEDSARVLSYHWTIGSSSFDREKVLDTLFGTANTYDVTLLVTDKYNCTATSTQSIIVTKPVALFSSASNICGSSPVTFTDQSTSTVGIAEWQWDFGDGNTQTYTAPPFSHLYTDTGSYTIKLTVKDIAGCTDQYTSTQPFSASSPKAGFGTVTPKFCPGATLLFNDSSQGRNLKYAWDFGNGQSSTDQNPSIIYTAGLYTVKLVITDALGCSDSLVRNNYVDVKAPVAAFDIQDTSSICGLLETKFFLGGSDYESFYWDFGDSTQQSTIANPKHFYDTYGKYTPKLYVKGYGGCIDSASHQVNVYNPFSNTKIDYTVPPFACNQLAVEFNIQTPPGTDFKFYYGDGIIDSSGQTTLEHTYGYPNNYGPAVFLKDEQDCQVFVNGSKTIAIKGAVPVFNIDQKNFCDSGTVFLTNFTISNDPIISQVWDFGDGFTEDVKDPGSHSYLQPGLYPVSLTVTTQSNCTQTFIDTVRVFRTPVPVIDIDPISCIQRVINFNGSLAQPDTAIVWSWSFGDGRTSTEQNNAITYDKPGNYLISLTATNKLGCKNTDTSALNVAPLPVITTQNVAIPVGGEIVLPVVYSSGVVKYNWTPTDGLSCTNCPSPIAKPKITTTYTVNVTDSNTCTSAAEVTVTVACNAQNYFVPNTFSPNGDGVNDVFYPRGRGLTSVQSMKVFNRFGQALFDKRNFAANDPSKGWDGKLNGTPAPPDVYVYVIEFVCENAQIVTMKGNITLIR
ncbi:MAG: PKD domain-containing protein [Agriterribacter sp.]